MSLEIVRDDIYSYAGIIREYGKSIDHNKVADSLRKIADSIDVTDKDARIAELTKKAEKYRDALNDIHARVASGYFVDAAHLGDIARNALKDV